MVSSPLDLRVLHGLRLKGLVDTPFLAELVEADIGDVESLLELAAADGFVKHRTGGRSGWSLTDEGRKEQERLLAVQLDEAERRADVQSAYRRFLALNGRLLQICTDWQVIDGAKGTLNTHDDPAYDAGIVAQLIDIDRAVQPICAELGGWIDRFDHYGRRFSTALAGVVAGEIDWFTKPTIDSYHTVWFELHEDLLVTLGIDRASERA
ncbi:MAG: hypothetical protein WBM50_05885 [Acidimicrobiales bacterium]